MKHNKNDKNMSMVLIVACSFLLMSSHSYAMLAESSFTGTGGYAVGGTPYVDAGMSYYYNPQMDYSWDGQQWIFKTGAKWPPRCSKQNQCNSYGYRRAGRSAPQCSSTVKECLKAYKNHNFKG